jgi:hypothetical protein
MKTHIQGDFTNRHAEFILPLMFIISHENNNISRGLQQFMSPSLHLFSQLPVLFFLPGSKSTGGGPSTSTPAKPVPIYFGMEQQRRASGMGARSMKKLNVVFSFNFENCFGADFSVFLALFPPSLQKF